MVLLTKLVACALKQMPFFPPTALAQPVPGLKVDGHWLCVVLVFQEQAGVFLAAGRMSCPELLSPVRGIPGPSSAVSGTSAIFLAVLHAPA